jgi:hypothetical protein
MAAMSMSRNRRRLLIATVVAVFLGSAWWLMMPSIDPRIVGTWQDPAARLDMKIYWQFKADGTGDYTSMRLGNTPLATTVPFRWRVEKETIFIVEPNFAGSLPAPLLRWYERMSGRMTLSDLRRQFDLVAIGPDDLHVQLPGVGGEQHWHRVTERTPPDGYPVSTSASMSSMRGIPQPNALPLEKPRRIAR